ncbi:MAG: hypothetical protein LIV24_06020 [Eubacterium sp.]|nr:hypothetical protein [Eubacterium sp.]
MKGSNGFKRTRKILLSALAVATLLTGSALPAFADDTTTKPAASFNKSYTLTMPTGETATDYASPAETFTFTSGKTNATATTAGKASLAALKGTSWNTSTTAMQNISDLGTAVTNSANIPQTVSVSSADFSKVAATVDGVSQTVNISLDGSYTEPGVYYYDFHETAGTTAGVTYDTNSYRIAVAITNKDGTMTVNSVNIINLDSANENKVKTINNNYAAGKLSFKKVVAGNMGDITKQFKVTVILKAPSGKTVNSTIGVSGTGTVVDGELGKIKPTDWTTGTVTKTYTVQNGTEITLKNIPDGVSCFVQEDKYSDAGYETEYTMPDGSTTKSLTQDDYQQMVGGKNLEITITNTRNSNIDTGIFTTNLPYILILVVAIAGAVAFVVASRKRRV